MLWLLLSSTILGFTLLALGLRGKVVGDEPRCRKCRFDLTGLETQSPESVCPECALPLAGPKSVRRGVRHKQWKTAGTGITLFLPMVVAVAIIAQGTAWISFNASKPLWVLELDARFGSQTIQTDAVKELIARTKVGLVSEGMQGRLYTLAASQLGHGDDANLEWYDFAVAGRVAGKITETQWAGVHSRMIGVGQRLFEDMEYRDESWDRSERFRHCGFGIIEGFTFPDLGSFTQPVQVLHALQSVEVDGEPLALVNRSARSREDGQNPEGVSKVLSFGVTGGVGYSSMERVLGGPDWKVVVKIHENWLGHEISEGLAVRELSVGKHTATATWEAYLVVGPGGGGPHNTPTAPAFGPFEVTKEYEYTITE